MKNVPVGRGIGGARPWPVLGLCGLLLALALIVGTHLPQPTLAANTVLWTEVSRPATTVTYLSEVCGDVNGDGHLDLIGGALTLGVGATAGHGDGTWTPLPVVTTSGTYYGLAVGDVNDDGKLDLVGAEDGSGIHVWTGDGLGGWTNMTSPAAAGKFWSVALGDVNGDGKLDIAAGSGDATGLKVWTGDGAGTWTLVSTGLPADKSYTDVALGDVDRDGWPDLAAASYGIGVQVWRANGAGAWTERSTGLPSNGDYYGVALGDLDNDGDLDLVASGNGLGVGAWTSSGGPVWTWLAASEGLPKTGAYWDVGLADLDNDGKLDVAATSYGSGVQAWTGDGGKWAEQSTGLPIKDYFYDLAIGDWDEDGMPDLSAGENSGARAWVDDGIAETPDGWVQIASPTTSDSYEGLDVGDWNHDGKLDLVGASQADGIDLWQGDGGNTWEEIAGWTSPDLPTVGNYAGLAFGDLDHNGWLDVVAGGGANTGIRAWLFVNEVAWIEKSTGLPVTGSYLDLDLGDLDNDGYLDLAAVGEGVGVRAWVAEEFDTVPYAWWDPSGPGMPDTGNYLSVAFGDLDDDGNLDVVAGSSGSGLGVWQGDGAGNWTARTSPIAAGTWQGVAVGDVNGDGKLDVVAASDTLGVCVWAGDGAFSWSELSWPVKGGNYTHVDLGDVNNDGKLDLAAGTGHKAGLVVWTGDGGTSWTPYSVNLPIAGAYSDVALGEIDHDGFLDLVGARNDREGVQAWTGAEGAPPGNWQSFAPAGWVSTTQQVDCTVQVQDTGSGLDVDSAAFSYLGVTGAWSAWKPAKCTGSDGTTAVQTLTAEDVPFNQDSDPSPTYAGNWIKFRIADIGGNAGYSDSYLVKIDTTPPNNPTDFPDSSHWPGGPCLNDDTIWVEWDGASDATSGLGGYSYLFRTEYELPDAGIDTMIPEATSGSLADGWWNIYVRACDQAGNCAPEAAYDGPFCIDTGPPTNPTDFNSSHEVGVWSTDNTIYIEWWGAQDPGSGVDSYSFVWTQSAGSSPDTIPDTDETHTTSEPRGDGQWYFHLKTRDNVGLWATTTVHWGPFPIDRSAPSAWINLSSHVATTNPFNVPWNGWDGTSGVAAYDVQTSTNAIEWHDWILGTTDRWASYTGQPDETCYFRVRAMDNAGNVGDWSEAFDITVGEEVTVLVEDEWGTPLPEAVVYLNGVEQGETGGDGTLVVHGVVLDDELAARYLVEEAPSPRAHHEWPYDSNWGYRTYITNVDYDADGSPLIFTVNTLNLPQVLVVHSHNPLIGFRILVSVEWDAERSYLDEVEAGFLGSSGPASGYLHDLTDGQMLFEAVEVVDNKLYWADADYQIHASNQVLPHVDGGRIYDATDGGIQVGRYISQVGANYGQWDLALGRHSLVHEFGHYGFDLGDEYLDADGVNDGGCTTDQASTPEDYRACFMDDEYTDEICSSLGDHPHNTDTWQQGKHGEPCWDTIYDRYHSSEDDWQLERPSGRGSVMRGPSAVPVRDWNYSIVTDADTGACPPFARQWLYSSGEPVEGAEVWVEGVPVIHQGQTVGDGWLKILGAHDGDTVRLHIEEGSEGSWSDEMTASCPDRAAVAEAAAPQVAERDPFSFHLSAAPRDGGDVLEIRAQASVALGGPPTVQVWQDGVTSPISPALTYDSASGAYTGTTVLSADLGQSGLLRGQASDTQGRTVIVLAPFNVTLVAADQYAEVSSDDGNLELILKPNSLAQDAAISILPNHEVSTAQGGLALVGQAYQVSVSTGQYDLDLPGGLNFYYQTDMLSDVISDTLRVYGWDAEAGSWLEIGGVIDTEHNGVSTLVDHLSTFAILGEKTKQRLYLPLILRRTAG